MKTPLFFNRTKEACAHHNSKSHWSLFIFIGTLLGILCVSTSAKEYGDDYALDTPLEKFEYLVHELNYRRRLQFLFPNPQSIFYGLNIGYVQTSAGGLSFQRRDLVVISNPTLITSRVYDSKQRENNGFGPGWRLNLLETIEREGNSVIHIDGAGARHRFQHQSRALFVPTNEAPETHGSTLAFIGDAAIVRNTNGEIRQFERVGGTNTYVMVRRVPPNGESITYDFIEQRLNRVAVQGREILQVEWSGDRIVSIKDRSGREVRYEYDDLGRLSRAIDLNHQIWKYEYDTNSRLNHALYPDGKTYLSIEYDPSDRVAKLIGAREFSYRYFDNVTVVMEPDGHEHRFVKDKRGITVGYRSNRGSHWHISMDESGRLAEFERNNRNFKFGYEDTIWNTLEHPDGTLTFHYDERERFVGTSGERIRGEGITQNVDYEDDGKTVSIQDELNKSTYLLDESKRISEVRLHGIVYRVERNVKGFITNISMNDDKLELTRNEQGRIESALYPHGTISKYGYDGLGNRNVVDFSNGARILLDFDGRGNIVGVADVSALGERLMQSYSIDPKNRVTNIEFDGGVNLAVQYDYAGRPTIFEIDGKLIEIDYYANGEIARLRSGQNSWSPISELNASEFYSFEVNPRIILHNERKIDWRTQPYYRLIEFPVGSFDAKIVRVENDAIPGYTDANLMRSTIQSWMNGDIGANFERPSNPIFQPLEYESTNCCTPCPVPELCGYQCTTYFLAPGEYTCQCQLFDPCSLPAPNYCTRCSTTDSDTKDEAKRSVSGALTSAEYAQREEIFLNNCPNPYINDSNWEAADYQQCVKLEGYSNETIYAGHTHPKYDWERDRHEWVYCKSTKETFISSRGIVNELNRINNECSNADISVGNKVPLLLRTTTGTIKKCGSK